MKLIISEASNFLDVSSFIIVYKAFRLFIYV